MHLVSFFSVTLDCIISIDFSIVLSRKSIKWLIFILIYFIFIFHFILLEVLYLLQYFLLIYIVNCTNIFYILISESSSDSSNICVILFVLSMCHGAMSHFAPLLFKPCITIRTTTSKCLWLECESHSVVSNSLRSHGLHCPWNFSGQNTGVDNHSLLQEIFPTQELNWGLLYCRRIL